MPVIVSGNEIVLNGTVGDMYGGWFDDGDCFTASSVIAALAKVGHNNDVVIRINSGGGIATEGSAIHAALARHGGKKTVVVEGIAASAASIIAMAGDDVSFALGAVMMVHLPSGFTVGTVSDHQMQISALTALGQAMASIYAEKSGQTAEACLADMTAETWMTADDAIAKGYADRLESASNDNDAADDVDIIEPAPFDYTLYAHAPRQMVAMAKDRKWNARPKASASPTTLPAGSAAKEPVTPLPEEQDSMPTEKEIQDRIDAAAATARAEGKAEASASALSPALAADIAKLCNDGGVPAMTASLLAEKGITIEKATARVKQAGEIEEHVALAHRQNPAAVPKTLTAEYIAAGKTPGQVKEDLFDKMAAASEQHQTSGVHTNALPDAKAADKSASRAKSMTSMEKTLKSQGLSPKKEG